MDNENLIPDAELTDVITQYTRIKDKYSDVIVLIRVGDHYLSLGPDAPVVAELMEMTLTSIETTDSLFKNYLLLPYHQIDNCIARLLKAGHRAAFCDRL